MIIKCDTFENINVDLELIGVTNLSDVLFLDIETMGLSPRNSSIYLIGLTSYQNECWTFTGLFAENPSDEVNILTEFISILNTHATIVHFNGNRFDLPFLKDRAKNNGLNLSFDNFISIDLYKKISSFKHLLGIGNCKQKTIELFLGIMREDKYNGGELINVYKEYIENPTSDGFNLLYQHNHDDLLGMLEIIPIFNYEKLAIIIPKFNNSSENEYIDYHGNCCSELMIEYDIPIYVPSPISLNYENIFLSIRNNKGYLKIPLLFREMKHYFDNYKDYYYLPKEDIVIHKAIAASVDKEFRQKATKDNCFIKKSGIFIPYLGNDSAITFKENYDSKCTYIEFDSSFTKNIENLEQYFHQFINHAYKKSKDR